MTKTNVKKEFLVKQTKSTIGLTKSQKETLRCLGLRRIGHQVVVKDNSANRGQLYKVQHIVQLDVKN